MTFSAWLLTAALWSSVGAGCHFETDPGMEEPAPTPAGKADDGLAAIVLYDEDSGARVDAFVGQDVVVRLAVDPTVDHWAVVRTDDVFGYPQLSLERAEPPDPDHPGTAVLTWRTSESAVGSHHVRLGLQRLADRDPISLRDFLFRVDVHAGEVEHAHTAE